MAKSTWETVTAQTGRNIYRKTLEDGTHLTVWTYHDKKHIGIVTAPNGQVTYRKTFTSASVAKSQVARNV